MNCGSSSSFVRSSKPPTRVTRVSYRVVSDGPLVPTSSRILRNLNIRNRRQFLPTRS